MLLGRSSLPFASLHTLKTLQTLHSRVAACPLPAHSPLLLGRSSLPFASLQTLKILKTRQIPRGSFHQALWPSAFAVPNLNLRPFQVTPATLKSPCRACAYDPQTSTYDPSRSHLYDPDIPHMEGRQEGVASRGQSAQRWKDEKTQTRLNRVFRLTMHSACKTKTEKDRERQRKTQKDRERQKAHTHTHTETETRKSQFLNSATGPGFGPKIWHQV